MANLVQYKPSALSEIAVESIVDQIARGRGPNEISAAVHPDDPKRRRALARRLRTWMLTDDRIVRGVHERAHLELMFGLGPATRALVRRANSGRPDAIKLLFEASGFHNPKSRVEHSGEIKIKLDMPRPTFNEPDGIVDAEVVD